MRKIKMTEEEKIKCHGIIHTATLATAGIGGGLAQIPTSDNLAIVPIQVAMIIALGAVFNITLDESTAKATLATTTATITGRSISQVLIGWMPGIGNILNAITAASLTESIGWAIANDFNKKVKLERLNIDEKIKKRI
jgi:uncharacterized protein (DUF697 family)